MWLPKRPKKEAVKEALKKVGDLIGDFADQLTGPDPNPAEKEVEPDADNPPLQR